MGDYIATIKVDGNYLVHYGTKRHSGRFPYGSGENPYQHEAWFKGFMELKEKGLSEVEIAKGLGISTTKLRALKSISKAEKRAADTALAIKLKDSGMSNVAIGKQMGINESSVRSLLNPVLKERNDRTAVVAEMIKKNVDEKGFIDIGPGVNLDVGAKQTMFDTAVEMLKEQGYKTYFLKTEQLGTGHYTSIKVLCPPGTEYKDLYKNRDKVTTIADYIDPDNPYTIRGMKPPVSLDSSRIKIRYNEEGGINKDGVIELRRGVEDISLGNSQYAQVRIAVDGTHYLKGMAMYKDDMPEGVDVIFNTNKHLGTPPEKVFKELKPDPANPFGATIKLTPSGQREYVGEDGEKHQSVINIVNEEGDWSGWSRTISSQILSKQPVALAKRQLDLSYAEKKQEFEEIKALTNPVVKKKLLESFADDCDASAVHLKAAALPRQAWHVILPIEDMKENEIYAPNYKNGEHVVLIRSPHGGKFEIPELIVNNKQKTANSVMHNAVDAVGINAKVAERLSGADFDGDTVLVIPTGKNVKISTSPALEGLKDFDPKEAYKGYPGMPEMKNMTKQNEMGRISNLITDMTLMGADDKELARAVKHSMVVIDAEKHHLDYKRSYVENGIAELKKKYQPKGGASTLISRAKSETHIPQRSDRVEIDAKTGKKIYHETGETYTVTKVNKRTGEVKEITKRRTQESTQMADTDDAFTLSSGTRMENVYAAYANSMKDMANEARRIYKGTKNIEYSPSAKITYAEEVKSLNNKLENALRNAPRERQAQLIANFNYSNAKKDNPDMDNETKKKLKSQYLSAARARFGAGKDPVDITDREWEAIQSGAVSTNTLTQILNNTKLDDVKKRAMPRESKAVSDAVKARIRAMEASGYSTKEIAEAVGVSTSTVSKAINGE